MNKQDPLQALGRVVAGHQDAVLEAFEGDATMRQHVAHHAANTRRRGHRPFYRVGWLLAAAAASLPVGLAAFRRAKPDPAPVAFTVGSPPVQGLPGELAVASNTKPLPVRFSEGTTVVLEPGARARFVGLGPHGAEVILESGGIHVEVVPRPHAEWSVRAGSFAVRVRGTKFDVAYDPRGDDFSLALFEGSVVVSGCGFEQGRRVTAGGRLRSSCTRHEPIASAAAPAPESSDRGGSVVAAGRPPVAPEKREPHSPRGAAVAETSHDAVRTWLGLARKGYYAEAFEVTRGSFEEECGRRSAAETLLLGDTARLSGHPAEARGAYAAVRNRFPGSPEAAQAAFALGRLALHANGDRAGAEQWFATSLRERGNGPLSAIALGRLLELRVERGDHAGAESVARDYLERFPNGPHAADARKLVGVLDGTGGRRPE